MLRIIWIQHFLERQMAACDGLVELAIVVCGSCRSSDFRFSRCLAILFISLPGCCCFLNLYESLIVMMFLLFYCSA
ncbi:hypothetical protein BDZ45DRAFT_344976 [Acephala macrosclerotiorum]|nr:hypothetical protein BDZ45DRAFT_344976 [Acephala macrosclerotiorum]